MSLSNPTAKNPAKRFLTWKGGEEGGGRVVWYDKEAEVEKEVKLPFQFIVLDELTTITGFSKADHSGFWSNEIRDLKSDELVVRNKAGLKARGVYAGISDKLKGMGAKYAKSVYIAFKDETNELVIGNLRLSGAAFSAWINFQKKYDTSKCAVVITDTPKKDKNGSNVFFVPVFEAMNISANTLSSATALDRELQAYLGNYLSRKPEIDSNEVEDEGPLPIGQKDIQIEDLDPATEVEEQPAQAKATAEPEKAPVNMKDVEF